MHKYGNTSIYIFVTHPTVYREIKDTHNNNYPTLHWGSKEPKSAIQKMSLTFSKLYILYLFNNNNNKVWFFFIYTIAKERLNLPTDWLQWIYGTEPRKQNNPPLFKNKIKQMSYCTIWWERIKCQESREKEGAQTALQGWSRIGFPWTNPITTILSYIALDPGPVLKGTSFQHLRVRGGAGL